MTVNRRNFLQALSGLALSALPVAGRPDAAAAAAAGAPATTDWCGSGDWGRPLFVPGTEGFLGRLELDDSTLTLRAARLPAGTLNTTGLTLAYSALHRGREFFNPTLVLR